MRIFHIQPRSLINTICIVGLFLTGCMQGADTTHPEAESEITATNVLINAENWPKQPAPVHRITSMEQDIDQLLSSMTLEEKVGQVIQADIAAITPDDVREFKLGSILNGGGSAPDNDLRAPPEAWLALADEFWKASTDTSNGGAGIPLLWGTDAVHGHNNIVGATIFPHNIGLGAANDPDLIYEIGRITALEIRTTGMDWTFAPTLTVVRNDRWGRTYEGYSEDPQIVAAYAPKFVEGLQGTFGSEDYLGEDRVIATAKHFVGDGGTVDGIDQGDNQASEEELRDIHAAGYPPAIAAGVQTVMASFSSFHGRKMHGFREMLNDVLVDRMGFDGFVIGDWSGHGQLPGCSKASCPDAFNAGLDMFMAPNDWKALYNNTLKQVRSGVITTGRLDEAVARILRVKMRAGLMDEPMPSERTHAADWTLLGAPPHRAVAREAVRKSLVLLKNKDALLPLAANSNVLVTGTGAHDIGMQSGGWTLSWQGTENLREHFPNGTSIFEGIAEMLKSSGGSATLSPDGNWQEKPDAAIVVFGEQPYAEFTGDRPSVDYEPDDGLKLLRQLREQGIPTISVFISGRPLWINPEINASDAFVAAWLPGTEGAGIADVLIGDENGSPRHDFTGRLSFSWPSRADQVEVNLGDANYDPLFAYGYGLHYGQAAHVSQLSEDPGIDRPVEGQGHSVIELGKPVSPWKMALKDDAGQNPVSDARGSSATGAIAVAPTDYLAQEDTLLVDWNGTASLLLTGDKDISDHDADRVIEIKFRVLEADVTSASLITDYGDMDLNGQLTQESSKTWNLYRFNSSCFNDPDQKQSVTGALEIAVNGKLSLQISSVRLVPVNDHVPESSTQSCEVD